MRKEDCKVGDKVVPFQKTRGFVEIKNRFEESCKFEEFKKNGYLIIVDICEDYAVLDYNQDDSHGDYFAYEDFNPYIETQEKQIDDRPNFFNPSKEQTCDCPILKEKECKFYTSSDYGICKNRKDDDDIYSPNCFSIEAKNDYYKRNQEQIPVVDLANDASNCVTEVEVLRSEKLKLRIELEKQIALNVGKDEEINKLKATNGKLLQSIKSKNEALDAFKRLAKKDHIDYSDLIKKKEALEDRIFNLSLEIVSEKERSAEMETVINYLLKKLYEKNKG